MVKAGGEGRLYGVGMMGGDEGWVELGEMEDVLIRPVDVNGWKLLNNLLRLI